MLSGVYEGKIVILAPTFDVSPAVRPVALHDGQCLRAELALASVDAVPALDHRHRCPIRVRRLSLALRAAAYAGRTLVRADPCPGTCMMQRLVPGSPRMPPADIPLEPSGARFGQGTRSLIDPDVFNPHSP